VAVAIPATLEQPGTGALTRARVELAGGASTAVYVAGYAAATTELRVAVLRRPERLEPWCAARGIPDAMVGGFFVRPRGVPLGELRTRGVTRRHVAFSAPWGAVRACVHVAGGEVRLARRDELPAQPRGDLLQAGPLLVGDGRPCFERRLDPEGFSAGQAQFDSDITDGRHPRAALGLAPGRIVAVVCDGRSRRDAGLTLEELSRLMAGLGCHTAINLDGGGSTSLVTGGRLRNRPRAGLDRPEPGGRAVSTALLFVPRVAARTAH
jgi:Phosphodiester glycosidase